ncbi:hypothetical protein [Carboxylicivirga sp. 1411-1]|uniref:hypothetical protein n=2 Tax=Carboxylicivirga TaxID=1628153 RepID=UPI003D34DD36
MKIFLLEHLYLMIFVVTVVVFVVLYSLYGQRKIKTILRSLITIISGVAIIYFYIVTSGDLINIKSFDSLMMSFLMVIFVLALGIFKFYSINNVYKDNFSFLFPIVIAGIILPIISAIFRIDNYVNYMLIFGLSLWPLVSRIKQNRIDLFEIIYLIEIPVLLYASFCLGRSYLPLPIIAILGSGLFLLSKEGEPKKHTIEEAAVRFARWCDRFRYINSDTQFKYQCSCSDSGKCCFFQSAPNGISVDNYRKSICPCYEEIDEKLFYAVNKVSKQEYYSSSNNNMSKDSFSSREYSDNRTKKIDPYTLDLSEIIFRIGSNDASNDAKFCEYNYSGECSIIHDDCAMQSSSGASCGNPDAYKEALIERNRHLLEHK